MIEITSILKLPPKIMSALAISSGVILFLPEKIIKKLFMVNFKIEYGFIIGAVFVVSMSILLCYLVVTIIKLLSEKYYSKKIKLARKNYINNLDLAEKQVLRKIMNTPDKTLILPVNNGVVIKLNHYQAISPAGTNHLVDADDMRIPYFIQPWAYEELKKNPALLN